MMAMTTLAQTQPTSSEKQFVYVVAQGYFPNIPAELWSTTDKLNQFIESMNTNNTTWSPWPILVCMRITSDAINMPLQSFFITRKKFSVSTVFQVKDKDNKLINYPGALLLENYKLFTSHEDFISGFPGIFHSPKKGHIMTVFVNFEPDLMLQKEVNEGDSKLLSIQMGKIEEGWSNQMKKDNINFMRQMMQLHTN